MYNSIMFHCEFYDILQNCCRLSPHVSILVSGVVVQPLHKQNFHFKHRHRRNVTSHHFTSFLFTYFHFYVYSNFFGSYQLKDKYNTQAHIQQLNISLNFSSLLLSIERCSLVIYHHHISLLVNVHVGHLIGHLVNLHDQHHNL